MEPKVSNRQYKTTARKNETPSFDYSNLDAYDNEIFINEDAKQILMNNFSYKSAHSERWFISSQEEEDLGLPDEIGRVIIEQKWKTFYKHRKPYNMQLVKEF